MGTREFAPARSSYVTGDKICYVHHAKDADTVHERGCGGGFPAAVGAQVIAVIDLTTAEA